MRWNPDLYLKFRDERAAPFDDLMALVHIREGLRVIDLGCGTGELTRRLADALPDSEVLGIDNSPDMLARTAEYARSGLRFEQMDIRDVEGEYDLVFSHSSLQWLDDHRWLVGHLMRLLRPGGQLAVQFPSNQSHYSHQAILQVAGREPFFSALGGRARRVSLLPLDEYAELLHEKGAEDITVLEKVYSYMLEDADAVAEWISGTGLVPYFEYLADDLRDAFMAKYREKLHVRWPSGPVYYGFRRTHIAATRPA